MTILISFLNETSTFDQYEILRRETPAKLILFTKKDSIEHQEVKSNIETILGINTTISEVSEKSFSNFLQKFYEIIKNGPNDQYLFIGTNAPIEAILAAVVLGSFFDIRIDLQDNGQKFTIPNQTALSLVKKKLELLKIINNNKPDSLESLLTILFEHKLITGKRKNMRAKISYTLGILQKSGLLSIDRGERGRLKIKLTPIGIELVKIL